VIQEQEAVGKDREAASKQKKVTERKQGPWEKWVAPPGRRTRTRQGGSAEVFPRDNKWVEVKAGDIKGMVREIKKLRSENEVNAELKAELDEVRSDLAKTQKNLGEEKKRADEAQQSMKALGAGPGGGLQQPPRQSGEKVAEAVESTSLPSTQVLAQLLQTQQQQHQQQLQMHLQMHQQQQQMHQQQQQQMQQRLLELAQQRHCYSNQQPPTSRSHQWVPPTTGVGGSDRTTSVSSALLALVSVVEIVMAVEDLVVTTVISKTSSA
jgi:hypothetical protein